MNTDTKVILVTIVGSVVILTGAIIYFSKTQTSSSVSSEDIVATSGLHWHPKLSVYIEGEKQEFINNIGLGAIHQPMHTHDEDYKDGVIHMEMQGLVTKDQTRLGRFFEIWGKAFNETQIFEYKNSNKTKVKMFVDGKENKEFANYHMKDGDNIEIRYE